MKVNMELSRVFDYFAVFKYAPSFEQIHTFYGRLINRTSLKRIIDGFVKNKILLREEVGGESVYCRRGEDKFLVYRNTRYKYSLIKLNKATKIISILSRIPQLGLIGVTGTVSVFNADRNDDIDLFIVARKGRMWTCRLLVLFILQIMGVRRRRGERKVADTICCNLFFDERDMLVPKEKQNYYTAHEVIQMMPLVSKRGLYIKFIEENNWVFNYFLNARSVLNKRKVEKGVSEYKWLSFFSVFEQLSRILQLTLINRHKTNEFITDTQLWFFPRDVSTMRKLKLFNKS